MEIDPHATPKANVPDVVGQINKHSCPWRVRFAVCLLWLSISMDVIQKIAVAHAPTNGGYSFGWSAAFAIALLAVLSIGIWQGKHWARATLQAFYLIGFLFLLISLKALKDLPPYDITFIAISLVMQVAALWLLCTGSGEDWFRVRKDPS
jgi:hypothetical protein